MNKANAQKIQIMVVLISCYGLFLRLWKLKNREFWNDEVYQFHCMQGALKSFWLHQTYGDHTTFPGEYLLHYPLVQLFGMNKWALAIPHLLIIIIGFWLLFKISQIYFRSWVGFCTAFLIFALNDNLVFHALEFRPYAVLPVLPLAIFYLTHLLLNEYEFLSLAKKLGIGILFFLIINYHIYGVAILFCVFLFFFISRIQSYPFSSILPWRFILMVMIFSLPVWFWYAAFNHWGLKANAGPQLVVKTVFEFIPDPRVAPWGFLKIVIGNLFRSIPGYIFFLLALISFFWPNQAKLQQLWMALILIILPIGLILYFDIRSQYWFLHRQFVWVMPFVAVLVGWILDGMYIFFRERQILKQ